MYYIFLLVDSVYVSLMELDKVDNVLFFRISFDDKKWSIGFLI